jgi:predicted dehydrogenase
MATYRFRSGAMAQLWMSHDIPRPGLGSGLQLLLVGDEGMIDLDSYGHVRVSRGESWELAYEQPPFDPLDPLDPMRLEAYVKQLEDVIDAATDGRHPLVDGREGAATTEMLEAAEHSASTGLAVSLPL